jgi:hypothetical protein
MGTAWLWMTGRAQKAIRWLGDGLGELLKWTQDVFHGIASALLAGDIELATQILWTGLQVAWQKGVNVVTGIWFGLKEKVVSVAYGIYDGVRAAWELLWDYMVKLWIDVEAKGSKAALAVLYAWKTAINSLSEWLAVNLYGADKDYVKKMVGQDQASLDAKYEAAKKKIEDTRQSDREAEDAVSAANLAKIGKEYQDAVDKANQEGTDKVKAGEEALNKLNEQLAQLIQKANSEAPKREWKNQPGGVPDFEPEAMRSKMQSINFGTFSARAASIAGLGVSALEYQRTTARNTGLIKEGIDDLRNSVAGVTFA